ncbi:glyoxalase [Roseomonas sp. KE2513]|uniref:VOC family protein n=1 Tax=Roseomonas sp. KE2513 TaxID=2479202 RepID=UPI0018E03A28|nr:VOC family protein [Roseomonas sp. KE2513]MBI0537229.1 glyoxalase [Roseomonas sp. KE2513]
MRLQSVHTVTRNMDGAERFYRTVLDLAPSFRDEEHWCQFRLGDTGFALSSIGEAAPGASGSVAVFGTDDLDKAASRVTAAGGAVHGRRDMGSHGAVLNCADPEGNPFQIFARHAA